MSQCIEVVHFSNAFAPFAHIIALSHASFHSPLESELGHEGKHLPTMICVHLYSSMFIYVPCPCSTICRCFSGQNHRLDGTYHSYHPPCSKPQLLIFWLPRDRIWESRKRQMQQVPIWGVAGINCMFSSNPSSEKGR